MSLFARFLPVLLILAACAPRGELALVSDPVSPGSIEPIFVVTTRGRDPVTALPDTARSFQESYGRFDVSIPPDHEIGAIEWPHEGEEPNPATDFVTTAATIFDNESAFRRNLGQAIAADTADDHAAIIFVHGFNTNFAEGLYRLAQIAHDLEIRGTVVHYSWPSQARATGYLYDRDSALFARDGLEEAISAVNAAGARRVTLVAHSMGSYLLMETLRQMALRDGSILGKVDAVVLISPDIDVDVFRAQAAEIGQLPQPFVIFTSHRDRALGLSATLSFDENRLGNISDPEVLADLDVTLVDVTAYSQGGGHFTAVTSPELVPILNRMRELQVFYDLDAQAHSGPLAGAIEQIQNVTELVIPDVTP